MANSRWFSRPAARRLRDEFFGDALPVVFAGAVRVTLPDGETQNRPFVQLDVAEHPDIAAAFQAVHVHGLEQDQSDTPYRYVFVDGHGYMATTLTIPVPVASKFSFVLVWPDHQDVFDLLQQGQPLIEHRRGTIPLQPAGGWGCDAKEHDHGREPMDHRQYP